MKIVEYSKGSITEVENVFKVVESGAQGPEGTIGKLTTLTNKPIVIPADLALTGDSEAAFANKYSTWQQLIDTVLSLFANNISDVNATALTDGGETALHSHAGGGGGGGEWEVVETRPMTGNALELFTVGADDVVKLDFTGLNFAAGQIITVALTLDGGSTYPSTHEQVYIQQNTQTGAISGADRNSQVSWWISGPSSSYENHHYTAIIAGITTASYTYLKTTFGTSHSAFNIVQMKGGGGILTEGAVNGIKVAGHGGQLINEGTITLLKRTYQ